MSIVAHGCLFLLLQVVVYFYCCRRLSISTVAYGCLYLLLHMVVYGVSLSFVRLLLINFMFLHFLIVINATVITRKIVFKNRVICNMFSSIYFSKRLELVQTPPPHTPLQSDMIR